MWPALASPEPDFLVIGLLVLLYAAVIIIVGLNANERILRAAQLQIENATLNLSLRAAAAEVEAAKQDKWSTLAHLSHELRTPLNAILGFSEAMHRELFGTLGNEKYRDYAKHVHSGGEHLLKLANEILDLSSGENGTLAPMESCIDVTALVRDCVDLMTSAAEAAHVRLLYASGPDLPTLFGDETKLRRLLGHLLGNAVKFTPPGGAVAIDASRHADGGIVLAVRDTGIGMNQADVPRAMLPFVRLSSALTHATAGAGLGLPICKRLAELHGADFTVTSQRGVGTLCTVRFPASRSRLPGAAVQAA
jgi:signal transduction histidine kinase